MNTDGTGPDGRRRETKPAGGDFYKQLGFAALAVAIVLFLFVTAPRPHHSAKNQTDSNEVQRAYYARHKDVIDARNRNFDAHIQQMLHQGQNEPNREVVN